MHLTFTTLAANQTHYFLALCLELEKQGYSTSIISFHEESNKLIADAGIKVFNVFEIYRIEKEKNLNIENEFSALLSKYQIECPNILLSHEKVTFLIKDSIQLKEKFVLYFKALEKFFNELKQTHQNNVVLFQELGGFASIVSSFYVARGMGYDNIYFEPSFFKGRMFFVKNTFESYKVQENFSLPIEPNVLAYLENARANKTIVIPKKDASHYQHPIRKIVNTHNIKRLFQKLFSKYLSNQKEEFNYIGSFVYRHIRMLTNRFLFIKYYQPIPSEKFVYYPFHVPMDVALTVRAPLFVDQYYLIDYISRNIPNGYSLAIKEHPAMIGVVEYKRIKDLLSRNDNIVFLNPDINNHEVMTRMDLLLTVNSKTGAESLMQGRKVICLGDAFYNKSKSVRFVDNIDNLYKHINTALKNNAPNIDDINVFFNSTYSQTHIGELYYCSKENIAQSSLSISQYVKANYGK
ncbi:hypothetical protein DOM21_17600 [Bacteriovorax stolpii]|uniref:capsular polysaccharide export protein, LipB/KpsS family n=1 Tax=Bacteriovorax stolpii TaxID=960 RepID=UPI00115A1362|nr:hypothetical protein [Bacteriovorax stolpii]QDK43238.1 hypothetical protein DOM21_17600 [Bacteriovorax stolpii]